MKLLFADTTGYDSHYSYLNFKQTEFLSNKLRHFQADLIILNVVDTFHA
jgi:hypothetical protein